MHIGMFFLLVGLPLLELALLIKLGQYIGFWPTVGIVVATAFAGASIIHRQGMLVLQRAVTAVSRGEPPVGPVVDGMFLAFAGGLLLTPGLITDLLGLSLLIPFVRQHAARFGIAWLKRSANIETVVFESSDPRRTGSQAGPETRRAEPGRPESARGRSAASEPGPRPTARPMGPADFDGGPVIEGEFSRIEEKTVDPKRRRTRTAKNSSGAPRTGPPRE